MKNRKDYMCQKDYRTELGFEVAYSRKEKKRKSCETVWIQRFEITCTVPRKISVKWEK